MPELRNGKSYSNDEACGQQFNFEKGFLIRSSSTSTKSKTITTHEFLLSIHKKIQMHLMSEKPLSHLKMRKLIRMLNKMECASPRYRKYLETAQKILCQLYFNGSDFLNVEITDKDLVDLTSDSTVLASAGVSKETENLLSISQAASQELTILAMEEKENVSINSQAPNVMKLKYDYAQNDDDDGNFSFPLELLTNINFMDTQKSTDSGPIQQHINQLSDISLLENTQNKSAPLVTDNPLVTSCLTQFSKNVPNGKTCTNSNECNAVSMMKISRNIPFDAKTDTSYSTNVSSTTFEAVPKETIWKKPSTNCISFRNAPLSDQNMYVNSSNTENVSLFQRSVDTFSEGTMWMTPASISNAQSIASTKYQISDFQLPSEGSFWQEANVRMSQATKYDFNDSNVPEIISLGTDTTIIEKIVIDDDGDSRLAEESPNTDVIECSPNVNEIPLEKMMNNDNEGENESFVFNLTRANSTVTVINATPFAGGARDILNENLKSTLSKRQQPKATPFSQTSAINETEEVIINETGYFNSDSTIINKHCASSPYRSRTQSNSFLNYKVSGRSSRSSSSRRRQNSKSGKREFHRSNEEIILEAARDQAFSENLMLIDGVIHKKRDQMDCSAPAKESYLESNKKLEEKVLKKRNAYKAKWKDMSISNKISAKFANKFHVRIFEDPVESLINIGYKPNFNNVHFPRFTVREMHEQLKPTWEIAQKMDTALIKVVRELVEKNNADFTFNLPRRTDNDTDSDSSDVENEANTRWLKNYFTNTKNEMKEFMNDMHKERQEAEAVFGNKREPFQYRGHDDINDQLENVLKAMNDFDWLKE